MKIVKDNFQVYNIFIFIFCCVEVFMYFFSGYVKYLFVIIIKNEKLKQKCNCGKIKKSYWVQYYLIKYFGNKSMKY